MVPSFSFKSRVAPRRCPLDPREKHCAVSAVMRESPQAHTDIACGHGHGWGSHGISLTTFFCRGTGMGTGC